MPKFFIKTNQIINNKIQIIGEDVKHISQVLRLKNSEELTVCNLDSGKNYLAKLEQINKDEIWCNIDKELETTCELQAKVTIFQGLPKADKMEYIIQKNTELGAKEIVPVIMKRCVTKWEEHGASKKLERWQKIAESAAKQSGRDFIPSIQNAITIKDLCKKANEFDILILAYENEQNTTLKSVLKNSKQCGKINIGIIVGPEGGIEENEANLLLEAGAQVVNLGKRILRTETASIMIMSNIVYEYEM